MGPSGLGIPFESLLTRIRDGLAPEVYVTPPPLLGVTLETFKAEYNYSTGMADSVDLTDDGSGYLSDR